MAMMGLRDDKITELLFTPLKGYFLPRMANI